MFALVLATMCFNCECAVLCQPQFLRKSECGSALPSMFSSLSLLRIILCCLSNEIINLDDCVVWILEMRGLAK